jgi:hypothetical protein
MTMPDREIVVVNKGGGSGTIALLITALGGIAAAIWWFFPRGGLGGKDSPDDSILHFKLGGGGLTLDGTVMVPEAAAAIAQKRGVTADVRVSGDATEGALNAVKAAFRDAGVPLTVWLPASTTVGSLYGIGNR